MVNLNDVDSESIPIVLLLFFKCTNKMGRLRRMLFLSFLMTPFVDSEDTPASTNGVIMKDRNNKLCGDRAQPTSTNVLIYKMGWPSRLLFLAPFHISCNPYINKVGNRSYMGRVGWVGLPAWISRPERPKGAKDKVRAQRAPN